jgi:hypothetical protein
MDMNWNIDQKEKDYSTGFGLNLLEKVAYRKGYEWGFCLGFTIGLTVATTMVMVIKYV